MDLLLDKDSDLKIQNGDFVIGDSTIQDVANILMSFQGNFKSDPLVGANLTQLVNGSIEDDEFQRRIKLQIERDGKIYSEIKKIIELNYNIQ